MKQSLTGRVRNYILPASAENSLMPVYEAVTNALYAIQDEYPDDWPEKGKITIEVIRDERNSYGGAGKKKAAAHSPIIGFIITDNGIGLSDILFEQFQTLDTEYRAKKNGRGIGRLSWLKVFSNVNVISYFHRNNDIIERSFGFKLSNSTPFVGYDEQIQLSTTSTGTIVNLDVFCRDYGSKAPLEPDDIRDRVLSHFISLFAQKNRLRIALIDEGSTQNLSDYFFESIVGKQSSDTISILDVGEVNITHLLLPKKLAPVENSVVYCASGRSVIKNEISNAIGMKYLTDQKYGNLIYIGLISGDIFESSINHERTGFNFGDVNFDDVNKLFIESAKKYLAPYLEIKKEQNKKLLNNLLHDNPIYRTTIGDVDTYAENMPLNFDEVKLVQAVAIKRFRTQRKLIKQVSRLDEAKESLKSDDLDKQIDDMTKKIGNSEKDALAQYVVERRLIIELLQTRLRMDTETFKHDTEKAVHEVICPLGVTSEVMNYDDHNLWLLDDRLAFYSFIASDRPIKSFAGDKQPPSEEEIQRREALKDIKLYSEGGEPDLAIIQYPMLFRRTGTPDPVVIVEFKSPSKIRYTGAPADNPVIQIRKYIETLLEKKAYDIDGDKITDITKETPFNCYFVAEPSEQLYSILRSHAIYQPTLDGVGRFGYLPDLNAYFEFIPYNQVVRNAALRNKAFFDKLGLQNVKGISK